MITFDSKYPHEEVNLGVDFARLLSPGETISGASWGPAGEALLVGPAVIAGTSVIQHVAGGSAGETHYFEILITTSAGKYAERGWIVIK